MAEKKSPSKKEKCLRTENVLAYQSPLGKPSRDRKSEKLICVTSAKKLVCPAKAKRIIVCTGRDLKRMCPPKICQCAPKPKGRGLFGLLETGLKGILAIGLIYGTVQANIWGTPDDTQELYTKMCKKIKPSLVREHSKSSKWDPPTSCLSEQELFTRTSRDPYACDKPPFRSEEDAEYLRNKWNKLVTFVFRFITDLPGLFRCTTQALMGDKHNKQGELCSIEHEEIRNHYKKKN